MQVGTVGNDYRSTFCFDDFSALILSVLLSSQRYLWDYTQNEDFLKPVSVFQHLLWLHVRHCKSQFLDTNSCWSLLFLRALCKINQESPRNVMYPENFLKGFLKSSHSTSKWGFPLHSLLIVQHSIYVTLIYHSFVSQYCFLLTSLTLHIFFIWRLKNVVYNYLFYSKRYLSSGW